MSDGEKTERRYYLVPPWKLSNSRVCVLVRYSPSTGYIIVSGLPPDLDRKVSSLKFRYDVNSRDWYFFSWDKDKATLERVFNELIALLKARGNVELSIIKS